MLSFLYLYQNPSEKLCFFSPSVSVGSVGQEKNAIRRPPADAALQ